MGSALAASPAAAVIQLNDFATITFNTCQQGCSVGPNAGLWMDYTVPDDGEVHDWTFWIFSLDPGARLVLDAPNQVFGLGKTGGSPWPDVFLSGFDYTFQPTHTPGLSTYRVQAPKSYDNCGPATPVGELCSEYYAVWGNGTMLHVDSTRSVTFYTADPRVPEPSTWALLITGFGLAGAALRRRRAPVQA